MISVICMLFVEAGAWFQELVSKVLPISKVDQKCVEIAFYINKLQCNETVVVKGYC